MSLKTIYINIKGRMIETVLKVFTGTWQIKPLKRWDGTEWKLINN
jgi:hypothetical protein